MHPTTTSRALAVPYALARAPLTVVRSGRMRIEYAGRFTGSYEDMFPNHGLPTSRSYAATRTLA